MNRLRYLSLSLLLVFGAIKAEGAQHPQAMQQPTETLYPFSLIGQLLFKSGKDLYVGSGTVIKPSSVLTAGHNVYDPEGGFSTGITFNRGNYGAKKLSTAVPTRMYVLGGYQSAANKYGLDDVRSFAYDTAGFVFAAPVAGGRAAGYSSAVSLVTSTYYRLALGYAAEGSHTGDYPMWVHPVTDFKTVYGKFMENNTIYFEGGMSGGPLLTNFRGVYYVSGVIVSGSVAPDTGGIHEIDSTVLTFISTYLP